MQLSASVEKKKEKKNMTQKYVGIHTPSKRQRARRNATTARKKTTCACYFLSIFL